MNYGFLYQKIANATNATVIIHRMMSLLRFFCFSSAMGDSTAHLNPFFKSLLIHPGIITVSRRQPAYTP